MTYLGELKHFQKQNQFNGSKMLTFNEKQKLWKDVAKRRSKSRLGWSWWTGVCRDYARMYCDKASIHGVRFLTDKSLIKVEKIIWAIILLTTTIVCAYVYKLLAERYQSPRIQTIVEDSIMPVFFIPFPSIAICQRYRFNWSKMPAAQVKFLPPNSPENIITAFREFFQRFEDFRFGKFEYFENLQPSQLQLINNISIIDVMRFLTNSCEEIFGTTNGTCVWRKRVYNCCELFKLERTEVGFCYVFNSIITPDMMARAKRDKFFPYRNSKSGEKSGLLVQLRINITEKRPGTEIPNGVYVMVKKNDQWSSDWKYVNSDTYTRISITPKYTGYRPEIQSVPAEERKCLFDNEVHHRLYKKIQGLKYWRPNCRTQCHHEYIMSYCNCSMPLLFPEWGNLSVHPCAPMDFLCLYKHREIFVSERHHHENDYIENANEEMMCSCMNSCDAVIFSTSVTSIFKKQNGTDVEVLTLDFFFDMDYMIKYLTVLSYTYVELIGNFGGIIGLFLGASLLSAVELVYYFTVGFAVYVRKEKVQMNRTNAKMLPFKKVRPFLGRRKLFQQRF